MDRTKESDRRYLGFNLDAESSKSLEFSSNHDIAGPGQAGLRPDTRDILASN